MAAAVVLVQSRIYYIVLIFLISRHPLDFSKNFLFFLWEFRMKPAVRGAQGVNDACSKK